MEILTPLEDRVIVRQVKKSVEETTESGLVYKAKRETCNGVVVSVGQGRYASETGTFIPTFVAKGDLVLCGLDGDKLRGMPIEIETETGKEEVFMMREADILAVISEKS